MSQMDLAFLPSPFSSHLFVRFLSCSLLVHGSFFNDMNTSLPGSSGLCWSVLYDVLHVSLFLMVPSFVVPCCFIHGLVQEVSLLFRPFTTHRARFSTEPALHMHFVSPSSSKAMRDVPLLDIFQFHFQQSHSFNQCPQFFPLHQWFCFWCVPPLDLVSLHSFNSVSMGHGDFLGM